MIKLPHQLLMFVLCLFLVFGTASCVSNPDAGNKTTMSDPIEPVNRGIFAFNNLVDMALIEPLAKVYNFLLPEFARDGIQNFLRNLDTPIIVANDFLQGDLKAAGITTARFVINSVAGIGGLFDAAGAQGLPYHDADLGQTMGIWGFGEGFYLVIPIIGPSSLRDATGLAADTYADPLRLWAHNTHNDWLDYTREGVQALDKRARLVKAVDDLRKNSLDYYAAVRSAYSQRRFAMIHKHHPQGATSAIPDYDHP